MLQLCSHPEAEHVSDVTRIATHFNAGQWYMNVLAHSKGGILLPCFEKASSLFRPLSPMARDV